MEDSMFFQNAHKNTTTKPHRTKWVSKKEKHVWFNIESFFSLGWDGRREGKIENFTVLQKWKRNQGNPWKQNNSCTCMFPRSGTHGVSLLEQNCYHMDHPPLRNSAFPTRPICSACFAVYGSASRLRGSTFWISNKKKLKPRVAAWVLPDQGTWQEMLAGKPDESSSLRPGCPPPSPHAHEWNSPKEKFIT